MNIVVDTNRFISALIKDGNVRWIILNTKDTLIFPEFEFQEIMKYKEEILEKSGLSDDEFDILFLSLLSKVKIIETEQIMNYKEEADSIMKEIDPDDSIFIATALAFKCPIWSEDNHFKQQSLVEVITTNEMFGRL